MGWYDVNAPGHSDRLLDAVSAAMARHATAPDTYRTVHDTVRRAPLRLFPYFLWYIVDEDSKTVQVLAMTHHRRDPDMVRARLE